MADFRKQLETLKNWGKWGAEDERGALNYISAEKRQRAAGSPFVSVTRPAILPVVCAKTPFGINSRTARSRTAPIPIGPDLNLKRCFIPSSSVDHSFPDQGKTGSRNGLGLRS